MLIVPPQFAYNCSQDGVVNVPLMLGLLLGAMIVAAVLITGVANKFADYGIITDVVRHTVRPSFLV